MHHDALQSKFLFFQPCKPLLILHLRLYFCCRSAPILLSQPQGNQPIACYRSPQHAASLACYFKTGVGGWWCSGRNLR